MKSVKSKWSRKAGSPHAFVDASIHRTISNVFIYIKNQERNRVQGKAWENREHFSYLAYSSIANNQLMICAMNKESLHEKLQPPTVIAFLMLPAWTREQKAFNLMLTLFPWMVLLKCWTYSLFASNLWIYELLVLETLLFVMRFPPDFPSLSSCLQTFLKSFHCWYLLWC